jgi:hypothetical protein
MPAPARARFVSWSYVAFFLAADLRKELIEVMHYSNLLTHGCASSATGSKFKVQCSTLRKFGPKDLPFDFKP